MKAGTRFNSVSEWGINHQLNKYSLSNEEKAKIWEIAGERDNQISKANDNFKNNWQQLFKEEYERLLGEDRPNPQYNMTPNGQNVRSRLRFQAQSNIQQDHLRNIEKIRANTNNKIDQILEKHQENERDVSNDFTQSAQQDRDQENER